MNFSENSGVRPMIEVCRTCCFWGPPCCVSFDKLARAVCCNRLHGGPSDQDESCREWRQRSDVLGIGLEKWWMLSDKNRFLPAALVHDLKDVPGCNRREIDNQFLKDCLFLADNWARRIEAWGLYAIVRGYSLLKGE